MAHSHEKTKLSQFGFQDPDKKSQDHELACAYLSQEEVAKRLCINLFPDYATIQEKYEKEVARAEKRTLESLVLEAHKLHDAWESPEEAVPSGDLLSFFRKHAPGKTNMFVPKCVSKYNVIKTSVEIPISKGAGRYKTSIGFIDVGVVAECHLSKEGFYAAWGSESSYPAFKELHQHGRTVFSFYKNVLVEVKIGRIPVSDAIRQIKFYQEYATADLWVLVTPWDLTSTESEMLLREKIIHFKLSSAFESFKANVKSTSAQSPEI